MLIAKFDGPEEAYGVRNEILEKLNQDFANDNDIEIESVNEIITPNSESGSPRAIELGKSFHADIVLWAWYRPTENPNITIHIENITPHETLPLEESVLLKPVSTLAELESFTFQQQAGQETSALISFLAGFLELQSGHYNAAIERFDDALHNLTASPHLVENRADIYFYRAATHLSIHNHQQAIRDFDEAIQINPQFMEAYLNRGVAFSALGEHQSALQDFEQAVQIDP